MGLLAHKLEQLREITSHKVYNMGAKYATKLISGTLVVISTGSIVCLRVGSTR